MSYILDALRKADAQRERSPARGIHAQQVALPAEDEAAERASRFVWLAAGAAVGAALIGMLGWWLAAPEVAMPAAPSPPVAALPAAQAPVTAMPVPNPAPASPEAPATEVLPAAPPPRAAPAPAPAPALASATAPAKAVPPAAASGERLLSAAELPPEVARDLPRLTITGGVYSTDPKLRMLIVNGLILNEGAEAAPGVLLAQIRPKVAVLTFRGWRYGVTY